MKADLILVQKPKDGPIITVNKTVEFDSKEQLVKRLDSLLDVPLDFGSKITIEIDAVGFVRCANCGGEHKNGDNMYCIQCEHNLSEAGLYSHMDRAGNLSNKRTDYE